MRRDAPPCRAPGVHPRAGTAATEFAFILPLLIALTLACVDFGRVLYAYVVASNAARAGAEYGATHQYTSYTRPFWESQMRQAVLDEMGQLPEFDEANLELTIVTAQDAGEQTLVDVSVAYPFQTIVHWPGVPHSLVMRRQVKLRQVR